MLPAYNSSEFLKSAVQSILDQTYEKFELILVDDGSTDGTESIVKSFSDNRIIYFKIDHSGMGTALNVGLRNAKYEWVALMDSDDIACPERFASELNYKKLAYNDVVFPDSVYFQGDKIKFLNSIPDFAGNVKEKILLHGHICMSGVIFNKYFILEMGGFNESLNNSEDFDLWTRIIDKVNFIHLNFPLMYVRMRDNSLSRENYLRTKETIYRIKEKNKIYYSGITSGWNEFFYGSRNKARSIFRKHLLKPKSAAGYFISLLPETLFNYIIINKIVPKTRYFFYKIFFFKEHRRLQKLLSSLLNNCSNWEMLN